MWTILFASLLLSASTFAAVTPVAGVLVAQEVPTVRPGTPDEIKWRIEQLRSSGSLEVAGRRIRNLSLTLEAYERRGFWPLWRNPEAIAGLLRAIDAAQVHGLDPEFYHRSVLAAAVGQPTFSPAQAAELEVLRTDAFVRISRHLRFGKVAPQGPASDASAPWRFGGPSALDSLVATVTEARVEEALRDLVPRHFVYRGLMEALADLRSTAAAGGWIAIDDGPVMRRDSVDARVPELRRRLGVTPGPWEADTLLFDLTLEEAVIAFQHRHGLNEDGLVGGTTRAALNVPVERRIDEVLVNMERARWVSHELPDTFIAVNVAGARVYLLQGEDVVFETRAIVGKYYTQTPLFNAPMLYVELNPTWTVPRSIAGEILDELRRDPTYLERQRMRVLDGSGRVVDPSGIEFARYSGRTFPYVFRQDPGPTNALGEIKLMFPNSHHVYLHDTPSRGLFGREQRQFSHGCIRIQDPVGLAELVLADPERWSRERLRSEIDSGVTRTVRLRGPMPVFVLYWTAAVDLHGELHFYRDVYDRDEAVLAALGTDDGS